MVEKSVVDNPDIIPYALYLAGGAVEFIDVEDIAVKCYELAPERFGFRKYSYPNFKTFSKALRDLEEKRPDLLMRTPDGLQRQLSPEGLQLVERRRSLFERALGTEGANPPTRRRTQRVLNELRGQRLVEQYLAGERPDLVRHEVADLLLTAPDSPPDDWLRRAQSLQAAAADAGRADIRAFLEWVQATKPEWFRRSAG
jgi:hypothetical protein